MNPETVDVGDEIAALHFYMTRAFERGDDWGTVLLAVRQHRAAQLGTLEDDLRTVCQDCGAQPGEPCRMDCSSRWDDTSESTCRHCGRRIVNDEGRWIDPEATGDDSTWRETCDAHDTFTAEHEPLR